MDELLMASVLMAVASVVLVRAGLAARAGGLRRNHLAGIRTSATMATDEAWEAAHEVGSPWLIAAGVAGVVGSGVGLGIQLADGPQVIANASLLGGAVVMGGLVIAAVVPAHRVARQVLDGVPRTGNG